MFAVLLVAATLVASVACAADWIKGSYVRPHEDDTEAFYRESRNDILKRTFRAHAADVTKAEWRVAAVGMRDLFVNGERITSTALPPLTVYRKRVLEEVFDVTAHLRPGYFHMMDCGATTLWESWNEKMCLNRHSNCHPMFGSVEQWMMRYLLGICVTDDAVGCDKVRIRPHAVAGVTSASGWLDTPRGRISVSWKLADGEVKLEKSVPAGIIVLE